MRTSDLQESLGEGCLAQQVRVTGSILGGGGGGQDALETHTQGPWVEDLASQRCSESQQL